MRSVACPEESRSFVRACADEEEGERFLQAYDVRASVVFSENQMSWWDYETNVTDQNEAAKVRRRHPRTLSVEL